MPLGLEKRSEAHRVLSWQPLLRQDPQSPVSPGHPHISHWGRGVSSLGWRDLLVPATCVKTPGQCHQASGYLWVEKGSLRPSGKRESFPGHLFSVGFPVDSSFVDAAYSNDVVCWAPSIWVRNEPSWAVFYCQIEAGICQARVVSFSWVGVVRGPAAVLFLWSWVPLTNSPSSFCHSEFSFGCLLHHFQIYSCT